MFKPGPTVIPLTLTLTLTLALTLCKVFKPGLLGLSTAEVFLTTATKVADADGDGFNDVIATLVDGTTKVYLNPGGSNDFASVMAIEIEAPDPDASSPATIDVVVADINDDGEPDIVTVNDGGENVLYLGPLIFDSGSMKVTNPANPQT